MKGRKVFPPTYLLISIIVMAALHFLFPVMNIIPLPWSLLGIVPLAGGIALNLAADNALHKAQTTVKPFEESAALVTTDVYRISRHPMYLGFALVLIGVAVILGSLTPCLVIPIFVILINEVFVKVEERMIEERFGQTWLEYKGKVRRWI